MAVTHFDWANYLTSVKAIIKDVIRYQGGGASGSALLGYYRQPAANRWRGYYWDLYGGGGNLSTFQHSPGLNPNGNSGDWEPNKSELADYEREQMRALDSGFYQTTENCEEGLIGGGFDVMHIGQLGETSGEVGRKWGQLASLFTVVYSRYQCLLNLGVTLNSTTFVDSSQQGYYASWVNASFHSTGGHLCLSNGVVTGRLVPTDPPTLGNCLNFYLLTFIKSIITKMNATPSIRTYMRTGLRCRPLAASWDGDYLESGTGLSDYLVQEVSTSLSAAVYVSSSVWLNPAADADYPTTANCIGIVITSASTQNYTYNIAIDAEAYDLDPTRVHVLYSRVGAVRTELARFTDELDYDLSIVFDGSTAPCILLEIVTP